MYSLSAAQRQEMRLGETKEWRLHKVSLQLMLIMSWII
jgi:hypothetical protein